MIVALKNNKVKGEKSAKEIVNDRLRGKSWREKPKELGRILANWKNESPGVLLEAGSKLERLKKPVSDMNASERMDRYLEGKSEKEQLKMLNAYISLHRETKSNADMDRYVEAVNRKVSMESRMTNGVSSKEPMTEGLIGRIEESNGERNAKETIDMVLEDIKSLDDKIDALNAILDNHEKVTRWDVLAQADTRLNELKKAKEDMESTGIGLVVATTIPKHEERSY